MKNFVFFEIDGLAVAVDDIACVFQGAKGSTIKLINGGSYHLSMDVRDVFKEILRHSITVADLRGAGHVEE